MWKKIIDSLGLFGNKDPLLPVDNRDLKNGITAQFLDKYKIDTDDDEEDFEEEEDDEEDEEEEEEQLWNTIEAFVEDVRKRVKRYNTFYFEMCSTEELDFDSKTDVIIWWLSKDHPYAQMISQTNYNKEQTFYPCFSSYMGVIAYKNYIIEKAIEVTQELFEKYPEEQEEDNNNNNNNNNNEERI